MVDHYAFASLDQHKDNINNDIDSNAGTTTTKTTLRNGAKRSIMEPFDMDKVLMSSFTTSPFTKKLRTSHDSSTLTSVVTCNGEELSSPVPLRANVNNIVDDDYYHNDDNDRNQTAPSATITNLRRDENAEQPTEQDNGDGTDDVEDPVDEEPDWEKLGENEPAAQEQVDFFLRAREIRDEADERFSSVMDECNTMLENTKKQILQAAADMHNIHREELDYLEAEIKQTLLWNHQIRTKMKRELEETRTRAQGLFSQLLMTVSQPLTLGCSVGQRNEKRTD